MGRMHSGSKGKSKSYKPLVREAKSWTGYKPKEVEQIIVKLAKSGKTGSAIGLDLRDQYGIPDVKAFLGKKINQVLKEQELLAEIPEDLMSMLKNEVLLMKHLETNHKDQTAKRGLILAQSKAKRLAKYYKSNGRLPADWTYDRNRIALMVQ